MRIHAGVSDSGEPPKVDGAERKRKRVTVLLLGLLLTHVGAMAQVSGADGSTPNEGSRPQVDSDVDRPSRLPHLFLEDTKYILGSPMRWEKTDWAHFGLSAAAVAGTAVFLDCSIRSDGQDSWEKVVKRFKPFGSTYALATAGGFYLLGSLSDHGEMRATGADAISASFVSGLILVPALKSATGRARPYQEKGTFAFKPFGGNYSFPSGHTAEAFTVASVISAHYPERWVQVTTYGLASLVGIARLEGNAHWGSDILAGALIGTTVGKAVTRLNQQRRNGTSGFQFVVAPDIRSEFKGIQVGFVF
jgi:membrane-associated phospholipid phosphatase